MKKILTALTAALVLLLVCVSASAGQENPYFTIANDPTEIRETIQQLAGTHYGSSNFTTSISAQEVAPYEKVTVTCTCNMNAFAKVKQFWVSSMHDIAVDYYTGTPDSGSYTSSRSTMTFDYTFVVPGNYNITLVVYSSDGITPYAYCSYNVAVEIPAGQSGVTVNGVYHAYETMDQIVGRITSQCLAAGCTTDFEKVLWLHDWIVDNCYYDSTYRYYSAESVLVRGYSVCDGYSRALQVLLDAMGIQSTRATGGNHAWNVVKMDGKWYHVDPTWDDPTNLTNADKIPKSGNERHYYIGVTDSAIRIDHTYTALESGANIVCDSYEDNYYIATGLAASWTYDCRTKLRSMISSRNRSEQTVLMSTTYLEDNGKTYRAYSRTGSGMAYSYSTAQYIYDVAAHYLQLQGWACGTHTIYISDIWFTPSTGYMHMQIDVSDMYTLELPSTVDEIDTRAFGYTDFMNVILPEGMTSITSGMFKNCTQIWNITIPSTVTYIAPDAFDGCNLKVYCKNNYTKQYCVSHSIPYQMIN